MEDMVLWSYAYGMAVGLIIGALGAMVINR